MVLSLLSLLGLPPLGGFVGKLELFKASIDAGQTWRHLPALHVGTMAARAVLRVERLAAVRLAIPERLTLTARKQNVPIVIRNDTGRPVRVTLEVSSDNVLLRDEQSSGSQVPIRALRRVVEVPGRVEQPRIVVETRGPGSFSLLVRMRAADGYELSGDRYTLRSTLVGALGKVLTIGALTFLAMWWTRSIVRSRRKQAVGNHPSRVRGRA